MRYLVILLIAIVFSLPVKAHPSYGLAMDSLGNLYFSDIAMNGRGTVWRLNAEMELEELFREFHAHSLNVDSLDRFFLPGKGSHPLFISIVIALLMFTIVLIYAKLKLPARQ